MCEMQIVTLINLVAVTFKPVYIVNSIFISDHNNAVDGMKSNLFFAKA